MLNKFKPFSNTPPTLFNLSELEICVNTRKRFGSDTTLNHISTALWIAKERLPKVGIDHFTKVDPSGKYVLSHEGTIRVIECVLKERTNSEYFIKYVGSNTIHDIDDAVDDIAAILPNNLVHVLWDMYTSTNNPIPLVE